MAPVTFAVYDSLEIGVAKPQVLTVITQVSSARPRMNAFLNLTKPSLHVLMTLVTWFLLKIKLLHVVRSLIATALRVSASQTLLCIDMNWVFC